MSNAVPSPEPAPFLGINSVAEITFAVFPEPPPALSQQEILELFDPQAQEIIRSRLEVLSVIPSFLSKNFDLRFELNLPGENWCNYPGTILVNPLDLLNQPLDYCRYIAAHEGAHERLDDINALIPARVRHQYGFMSILNPFLDRRGESYCIEGYPYFEQLCQEGARHEERLIANFKQQVTISEGKVPRIIQAATEYLRIWREVVLGRDPGIDATLSKEVQEVVGRTVGEFENFGRNFPSKWILNQRSPQEAREMVLRYAGSAYTRFVDKVWPEVKILADLDLQEQRAKALERRSSESSPLSPPGTLPLGQINLLGPAERSECRLRARIVLVTLEEAFASIIRGVGAPAITQPGNREPAGGSPPPILPSMPITVGNSETRNFILERAAEIQAAEADWYSETSNAERSLINRLTGDIRRLKTSERRVDWLQGQRNAPLIDEPRRIKEITNGVHAVESRATQRRIEHRPSRRAVLLLGDATGSMRGEKIRCLFRGMVSLTEAYTQNSEPLALYGFNTEFLPYKGFREKTSPEVRARFSGILDEVYSKRSGDTYLKAALNRSFSVLRSYPAEERYLLVFTDGMDSGTLEDLRETVQKIERHPGFALAAFGLGPGTEYLSKVFQNQISNVSVEQWSEKFFSFMSGLRQFRRAKVV